MHRFAATLALALVTMPVCAAESAYTRTDLDADCRQVSTDEQGGAWSCTGYAGHPIHFAEGDLRQSAFYGEVGAWFDKGAFESFSGFNHAGDTTEWRLAGGIPVATIRRWFVAGGYDDKGNALPETQVLVISRVGQKGVGEACVAGYVEASANADANVLARQVADTIAPTFACRQATPAWHGRRKAGIETTNFFEQ